MRAARRALMALAVVALAPLAACAGDDDGRGDAVGGTPAPPAPGSTTTTVAPVQIAVTGAELVRPGGAEAMPADVAGPAAGTAQRWLEAAVLTPLRTGDVAPDLDVVATGAVQERLRGSDRAALVDEAVAPPGPVTATRADVMLTGLADQEGPAGVVVARFGLDLVVGADLHVVRDGELVLVPVGTGWLVDGYSLSVTRSPVVAVPPADTPPPAAGPAPTTIVSR